MTAPLVVTLGETLALVRSTAIGALSTASPLQLGVGGAESNVAIGLSRLGVAARWIGRVGRDSLGDLVAREIRAEGVDTVAIVDDAAPTALMIKETRIPGATQVGFYRSGSAGSRLAVEDLAGGGIHQASALHLTGISSALSPSAAEAANAAIDQALATGAALSFDVNHRPSLWQGRDDAGAVYRAIAARSTVVFAGVDEARLLAPDATGPEQLARSIASLGAGQVVIKLGADGCLALVDGTLHHREAVAITPVDTVGAGDAFVAGYLAELVTGGTVDARLALAVTTGAFACLHGGDWEGYPTRAELGLLDAEEPVTR